MKLQAENDFQIFVGSDLDLWPLDLELAPLVTLVQRCISTKLEVSTAYCFEKTGGTWQTDGQTDVLQHLMRPIGKQVSE